MPLPSAAATSERAAEPHERAVPWLARCPRCSERLAAVRGPAGQGPWVAYGDDPLRGCPCGLEVDLASAAVWTCEDDPFAPAL